MVKRLSVERQLEYLYDDSLNEEDILKLDLYRNNIIDMVVQVWGRISNYNIIKSFEKTRITLSLERNENDKLYSKFLATIGVTIETKNEN